MRSLKTFDKLIEKHIFRNVLDVGSGEQQFTKLFREQGIESFTTDYLPSDYQGDFNQIEFDRKFEAIWCAHVLEHQLNVNYFLTKLYNLLEDNGVLAISVPPLKHNIVGGHVTLWNGGLLLYNLILAGFDCSEASVIQYDYDVSVIVKKKKAELPKLNYDFGDIEKLEKFFPMHVYQGFNGQITNINWN